MSKRFLARGRKLSGSRDDVAGELVTDVEAPRKPKAMLRLAFIFQDFLLHEIENVFKVTRFRYRVVVTAVWERTPGLGLGLANSK